MTEVNTVDHVHEVETTTFGMAQVEDGILVYEVTLVHVNRVKSTFIGMSQVEDDILIHGLVLVHIIGPVVLVVPIYIVGLVALVVPIVIAGPIILADLVYTELEVRDVTAFPEEQRARIRT